MKSHLCSGCGACVAICPKKYIGFKRDEEGFLVASDKGPACIGCGLCEKVCPFLVAFEVREPVDSGYYISDDHDVRACSSSGGACDAVVKHGLDNGFTVVGAIYDADSNTVRHVAAESYDDARGFRGSKYLQSEPSAIYSAIDEGPCVVFGTPCQVAGARLYAKARKKEARNLYVDFYCHGVPSVYLWDKYRSENDLNAIQSVSFRNKAAYGWNDYTMDVHCIDKRHVSAYLHDKDFFYSSFLSNLCLNKPCYADCPFRGASSQADLRVGDAWGHDIAGDNMGTSVVLGYGEPGHALLNALRGSGRFVSEKIQVAASAQLDEGPHRPANREKFIAALRDPRKSIEQLSRVFVKPELTRKLWRVRFEHLVAILTGKE